MLCSEENRPTVAVHWPQNCPQSMPGSDGKQFCRGLAMCPATCCRAWRMEVCFTMQLRGTPKRCQLSNPSEHALDCVASAMHTSSLAEYTMLVRAMLTPSAMLLSMSPALKTHCVLFPFVPCACLGSWWLSYARSRSWPCVMAGPQPPSQFIEHCVRV